MSKGYNSYGRNGGKSDRRVRSQFLLDVMSIWYSVEENSLDNSGFFYLCNFVLFALKYSQNMEIQIADNKSVWDNFLLKNKAVFTQSWDWGSVLLSEGKKIERLLVLDSSEIIAAVLVIYNFFPFGIKYVYSSWGPVFASGSESKSGECLDTLGKYFKDSGCVFVRIEPIVLLNTKSIYKLRRVKDVSPSHTLVLDLTVSEDRIMSGIEKKTRYEIRQAQKNNLEVKEQKDFDIFWSLMKKTASHDGFRTHSEEHYKKILESDSSVQLNAYYHGQPIATAIFWQWDGVFTYLFAATDRNFSTLSAAYLIQWEAIKLAMSRGCVAYDFFGVAPKTTATNAPYDYDRKHRYAGFTKFKVGFGGQHQNFPGTYDLVLNPIKYYLYLLLRLIRRLV